MNSFDNAVFEPAAPVAANDDVATRLFNSTVAGFAVATAWETGALDELNSNGSLDLPTFCRDHDLDVTSMRSVMVALASVAVVTRTQDSVSVGPHFASVYRNKAFFHWLTVGSGGLFSAMPKIVRNKNRTGDFFSRDGAAIGFACREINARSFDPVFWETVASLDVRFSTVADLGCGSGGRLAQLADRFPNLRGVGIDTSPEALRDASAYLRDSGFDDQFTFIEADVRHLEFDVRYADVELLTCFMMGHDFWPREQCVASLQGLRRAFPNARRLLLGDTTRTSGVADVDTPVFTLAFETAHDVMGVYLPTIDEWHGVFAEGGWQCVEARRVQTPADSMIFELAPLR